MTGVLYTARINAIEFIVSSDKLIKMVNFKLGNEMWRWINQHEQVSLMPGGLQYKKKTLEVARSCFVL